MLRLSNRSNWVLGDLLNGLSIESEFSKAKNPANKNPERTISVLGIDEEALNKRLTTLSPLNPKTATLWNYQKLKKYFHLMGHFQKPYLHLRLGMNK